MRKKTCKVGKSCNTCTHSKAVRYNGIYNKYRRHDWKNSFPGRALFCLALPPSLTMSGIRNTFNSEYITSGYNDLKKYYRYPIVTDVPTCSFYSLANSNKKIIDYQKYIVEVKLKKEKDKIEKGKETKTKQEAIFARKIEREKIRTKKAKDKEIAKAKREAAKKEKERIAKRKEYQRKYRAGKKAEKVTATAKADDYSRFDILGIEDE